VKRDMELVREVLLKLEELPPSSVVLGLPISAPRDVIDHHLWLLSDAGLMSGKRYPAKDEGDTWLVEGLTWTGHEFLDGIRDRSAWDRVKKTAVEKTGTLSFEAVREAIKFLVQIAFAAHGVGR